MLSSFMQRNQSLVSDGCRIVLDLLILRSLCSSVGGSPAQGMGWVKSSGSTSLQCCGPQRPEGGVKPKAGSSTRKRTHLALGIWTDQWPRVRRTQPRVTTGHLSEGCGSGSAPSAPLDTHFSKHERGSLLSKDRLCCDIITHKECLWTGIPKNAPQVL